MYMHTWMIIALISTLTGIGLCVRLVIDSQILVLSVLTD